MDSAYKLTTNILKLINQIAFIIQLILVVFMFLVTAYWFLNLLDIGLFNFMADTADAITASMHNIYDEKIIIGKNELDPALLVFDILGMVILVGFNFLKEFNIQKMKEIDSALEKIRVQREAEFNKKLQAEFEAKMKVYSNYAIIVTFIAKNLFVENVYMRAEPNTGAKEYEELAFKTLYAAVKDIPNCKFAKNGSQLILTSNRFDSIDKVLTTIDLATARIRQNFKKEKWLIYSLLFFILIFAWCCSTIRQMISMALAFYAWKKYEKGQRFTAILCIVFAFLFHYSSILYPFIYLICKKININRTKAFILFFTALALSFIGKGWLTNLLATLLANTGYGSYTTSKWFDPAETESGLGMIVRYISYFSILLFFPIDKVKNGKFILALFTLYTVIDIISIQVTIINRIGRGFIFCYLPCIYYISTTQYKYRQIAVFLVWGILAVSFLRQLTTGFNHCAPYMSIFNN